MSKYILFSVGVRYMSEIVINAQNLSKIFIILIQDFYLFRDFET